MENQQSEPQPLSLYRIVVAHYFVSAISFLILSVIIFLAKEDFFGHYFQPRLLAITHLAALGWATLIIFGACYQLLPVILEIKLHSYALAWFSFVLFVLGLSALVYAFWIFSPGFYMQIGGILLLVGIILFGTNVFITSRKIKKPDIYQDFILTSCIWLLATAVLGVLLVFNFRYAFLPKDHLLFLKLHAHMGIVGWFMMLIMGVSARLVPMFLVSTRQEKKLLNYSYFFVNLALVAFIVDTYLYGINIKTYLIAALAFSGIFCWLYYIYLCYKYRIRKSLDIGMVHTLVSKVLLGFAVVLLPFIVYYQLKSNLEAVRLTTVYGSILFMGWITSLILGQTFKTLPFIVWTQRYQFITGKEKTPLPANLYHATLLKVQFVLFIVFAFSFFTGLIVKINMLVSIGAGAFLLTAVCYLGNVLYILLNKNQKI